MKVKVTELAKITYIFSRTTFTTNLVGITWKIWNNPTFIIFMIKIWVILTEGQGQHVIIPISEAVTMQSLLMVTSIVSEESLESNRSPCAYQPSALPLGQTGYSDVDNKTIVFSTLL